MATISKFEDLVCFNKARELTKAIYQEFKDCKDYGFKDQITRASVSVLSNIAEGFERGTKSEYLNYLYIAKGSAGEVRAQLYVAYDAEYVNMEKFKYLTINIITKILIKFIEVLLELLIVYVATKTFEKLINRKKKRIGF